MKGVNIVEEIQLHNFRSLKDTGLQKLAPITLLIGENSSGKSSFLRVFPLIKQSINKRTSGPILWSGDIDDYVDFGSFEETVINDDSDNISFRFKFSVSSLHKGYYAIRETKNSKYDVDFSFTVKSNKGKDFVSSFQVYINSDEFYFDLENNVIKLNDGFEYKSTKEKTSNLDVFMNVRFGTVESTAFDFTLPNIDGIWGKLNELLCSQTEDKDKNDYMFYMLPELALDIGLQLINNKKLEDVLSKRNKQRGQIYYSELKKLFDTLVEQNTTQVDDFEKLLKICCFYTIFPEIEECVKTYFKNVHYIAPLRATAERYYRLRNLAVDEVDYQGKNLAIFINSLSVERVKNFNNWTMEHFGFSISTGKDKGHISLLIKVKNSDKAVNLSDSGFGYSQILPIITQLWDLSSRPSSNRGNSSKKILIPLIVAIEQPELHLHPAVQARLAKAFIASIHLARVHGYQLQLLLETHSETIVNYLGRAIAKNELDSSDVSIVLFEKQENDNKTKVENSFFDDDGYLKNWPYGFFESEE